METAPRIDVQRRFDGVSEKIGSPEVIAFSPTRPEKIYNWTLAGCEADCGLDEWSDDTTVWADGSYEYALEQGHCQPFEWFIYRSEKIRNGKLVIELAKWVRPGYESNTPE